MKPAVALGALLALAALALPGCDPVRGNPQPTETRAPAALPPQVQRVGVADDEAPSAADTLAVAPEYAALFPNEMRRAPPAER